MIFLNYTFALRVEPMNATVQGFFRGPDSEVKLDQLKVEAYDSQTLLLTVSPNKHTSNSKLQDSLETALEFSGAKKIIADFSQVETITSESREKLFGLIENGHLVGIVSPPNWQGYHRSSIEQVLKATGAQIFASVEELNKTIAPDAASGKELLKTFRSFVAEKQEADKAFERAQYNTSLENAFFGSGIKVVVEQLRPVMSATSKPNGAVELTLNRSRLDESSTQIHEFSEILLAAAKNAKGDLLLDLSQATKVGAEAVGAIQSAIVKMAENGYELHILNPSPDLVKKLVIHDMLVDKNGKLTFIDELSNATIVPKVA